jgi:hypothetical protein
VSSGPSRRARLPLAGGLLLIAIVLVVVLVATGSGGSGKSGASGSAAASGSASGGHALESIFQDDQLLLDAPTASIINTLGTLKALGVDRLRVTVLWRTIAPAAASSTEPSGFVGSNPSAYPVSGFAVYDRLVLLAHARGIGVDFNVTAAGPLWAMRGPADRPQRAFVYAPRPRDFGQFVTALGRRYDGSYALSAAERTALAADGVSVSSVLPRVNYWSIWNEPNQPGWLSPQWRSVGGTLAMYSPVLYRSYVDAAWRALGATGHGTATDTILVGELAPEGGPGEPVPRVEQPIPPMDFLEALYCVGSDFQPLSGSAAAALDCPSGGAAAFVNAHPGLFDATGFAHHPYSFFLAPNVPYTAPQDSGFVPLVSLSRLENGLDQIFHAYAVSRRLPIYLTEYGYETNPPNPFKDVSLAQQAAYLDEAQYMASQDPRVRAMSQFLLQDSPPNPAFPVGSSGYWSTFQTGLEFTGGAHKPAFAAYRIPIWIPASGGGSGASGAGSVTVWGMIRPAQGATHAQIQWRDAGGSYRTIATVSVGTGKTFTTRVSVPGPGVVRIAWPSPSGTVFHSRAASVG